MAARDCKQDIHALCLLTLNPSRGGEVLPAIAALDENARREFAALADSHHVVIRALSTIAAQTGKRELAAWARYVIAQEQSRIANALEKLSAICAELEKAGCPSTVMKSLDHWPDLGNDLDLVTIADEQRVVRIMTERFQAHVEPRSWGDRLANKWNFAIPGLKEAVEVHCKRLGQTGEHTGLARRFITRRIARQVGGFSFLVPAPEERILVFTLQRMYRHFYFRVCDVVDTAALVEVRCIDFDELRSAAAQAGIWPGVATYLVIVSDYVRKYRGVGLELPDELRAAARFSGEQVKAEGRFLRVPIVPYGAVLYTAQVTHTALRGDVPATFRLSLLPPLASAAAVAFRLTGSDKGVW
jgi:hypothetical protein